MLFYSLLPICRLGHHRKEHGLGDKSVSALADAIAILPYPDHLCPANFTVVAANYVFVQWINELTFATAFTRPLVSGRVTSVILREFNR